MSRKFSIILACDEREGIGFNGKLPWRLRGDMAFFKETTVGSGGHNAVIMGRKTYLSIPKKFRPLKDRFNIVLSRDPVKAWLQCEGALVENSLDKALDLAAKVCSGEIFVIGGASVYEEAFKHPDADLLYLTEVHGDYDCDTFVKIPEDWWSSEPTEWQREVDKDGNTHSYRFGKLVPKEPGNR